MHGTNIQLTKVYIVNKGQLSFPTTFIYMWINVIQTNMLPLHNRSTHRVKLSANYNVILS
jgi:hypothetical protein